MFHDSVSRLLEIIIIITSFVPLWERIKDSYEPLQNMSTMAMKRVALESSYTHDVTT